MVVRHRNPRPGPDRWLLAGYAGLAGFVALEAVIRKPGASSDLEASADDRDTTRGIIVAYLVAAALPPVLLRLPLRPLPATIASAGIGLQVAGLALRAWSMRALGASYSRTLRTEQEQRVFDAGPYRVIRHPGYLGSLLVWTGFGLSSRSLPVALGVMGLVGRAYRRRIAAEETLLLRTLTGYAEYRGHTDSLIPGVW